MHTDSEKLTHVAKESDYLSDKQKDIIPQKAEKIEEDVDEIKEDNELYSDTPRRQQIARMKCPNCGAVIPDTSFYCPECGYALQQESEANLDIRTNFDQLTINLMEAPSINEKLDIIKGFTMPMTKEGLSQFLEYSFTNYISTYRATNHDDYEVQDALKQAWYGKTMQAYNSLLRIGGSDPNIKALLEHYSKLIKKEKESEDDFKGFLMCMVGILMIVGIIYLCKFLF